MKINMNTHKLWGVAIHTVYCMLSTMTHVLSTDTYTLHILIGIYLPMHSLIGTPAVYANNKLPLHSGKSSSTSFVYLS